MHLSIVNLKKVLLGTVATGRQSQNGVSLCNTCELLWIPSFIQDWDKNVTVMQAKCPSKTQLNWPSSDTGCSLLILSHLYLWKIKITVNVFLFNSKLWIRILLYLAMDLIFNFFLISINSDVTQMFYHPHNVNCTNYNVTSTRQCGFLI